MYSVYQHWDPLKVCVVGRSYPPEFYSWITVSHVRLLFEKIAIETEEDYQNIIKKLQEFGVEILRPELDDENFVDGKFLRPPMTPRDYTVMIGNVFYEDYSSNWYSKGYNSIKDVAWPDCNSWHDFDQLPDWIKHECLEVHKFGNQKRKFNNEYKKILDHIRSQGNIVQSGHSVTNGANCSRIGKDLYFGTDSYNQDQNTYYKN
jgi:hypothetical protein